WLGSMDGFEVAQRIRAQERSHKTPIIFMTAFESEDFPSTKAYTLGAVDYLVKPLVPKVLRAKVAVFIDLFQNVRLRQSERRLRALLENAWDGILLLAPDGTSPLAGESVLAALHGADWLGLVRAVRLAPSGCAGMASGRCECQADYGLSVCVHQADRVLGTPLE